MPAPENRAMAFSSLRHVFHGRRAHLGDHGFYAAAISSSRRLSAIAFDHHDLGGFFVCHLLPSALVNAPRIPYAA